MSDIFWDGLYFHKEILLIDLHVGSSENVAIL